ncbi:unnamed protein product [Protopolystoma xenopodis]|uniref:Secreted protein n=1 Tax=Protopolystoma xenopodis TaxID=117903 RepID=A0A3S5CRG1_9PLAT|nr:unnamed protein product [Protopolystoma xenopodis]
MSVCLSVCLFARVSFGLSRCAPKCANFTASVDTNGTATWHLSSRRTVEASVSHQLSSLRGRQTSGQTTDILMHKPHYHSSSPLSHTPPTPTPTPTTTSLPPSPHLPPPPPMGPGLCIHAQAHIDTQRIGRETQARGSGIPETTRARNHVMSEEDDVACAFDAVVTVGMVGTDVDVGTDDRVGNDDRIVAVDAVSTNALWC